MGATRRALGVCWLVVSLGLAPLTLAQEGATQTMRPVIRGRQAAVSSKKAEATEAARHYSCSGGPLVPCPPGLVLYGSVRNQHKHRLGRIRSEPL